MFDAEFTKLSFFVNLKQTCQLNELHKENFYFVFNFFVVLDFCYIWLLQFCFIDMFVSLSAEVLKVCKVGLHNQPVNHDNLNKSLMKMPYLLIVCIIFFITV